ncbi:MAG: hypothetical protein JXA38_00700 [Methanosarcinaceae archaeon]|nr:hypothetical protein [Methanosarcinaceae archaeon]
MEEKQPEAMIEDVFEVVEIWVVVDIAVAAHNSNTSAVVKASNIVDSVVLVVEKNVEWFVEQLDVLVVALDAGHFVLFVN